MAGGNISVKILINPDGGFDAIFVLPDGSERTYASAFSDLESAESFAERVNRLDVSPEHIEDILEDALP